MILRNFFSCSYVTVKSTLKNLRDTTQNCSGEKKNNSFVTRHGITFRLTSSPWTVHQAATFWWSYQSKTRLTSIWNLLSFPKFTSVNEAIIWVFQRWTNSLTSRAASGKRKLRIFSISKLSYTRTKGSTIDVQESVLIKSKKNSLPRGRALKSSLKSSVRTRHDVQNRESMDSSSFYFPLYKFC